jgi:hypothetical protein
MANQPNQQGEVQTTVILIWVVADSTYIEQDSNGMAATDGVPVLGQVLCKTLWRALHTAFNAK